MSETTIITVHTEEPVTPEYIAQRVAEACASYGALRPGERVEVVGEDGRVRTFTVSDEPAPDPLAGTRHAREP